MVIPPSIATFHKKVLTPINGAMTIPFHGKIKHVLTMARDGTYMGLSKNFLKK